MTQPIEIGFPALAQFDATVLILGSMPGVASLQQQQYYAHKRNAFWPIMTTLFDWPESASYAAHCQRLLDQKIAVWDVLKSCHRRGSLDSNIDKSSLAINDFECFLTEHRAIETLCFNGNTAYQLFKRHVCPELTADLHLIALPSTSPAHAAMSFQIKLEKWQAALTRAR